MIPLLPYLETIEYTLLVPVMGASDWGSRQLTLAVMLVCFIRKVYARLGGASGTLGTERETYNS